MRFLACLLWMLMSVSALADLDVTVTKSRVVTGLTNPRVLNDTVLYDGEGVPKVAPAAQITVVTDYKFVRVKARTSLFESSNLEKIGEGVYLLVGPGKYALEVLAFDPEKGIDERVVRVELESIGPDEPDEPDVPDEPDNPTPVPPDSFNNIGQRVDKAAANLPKRAEVAKIYRDGAKDLRENPSVTVNDVFESIFSKRVSLLGSDVEKWKPVTDLVSTDVRGRFPMARLVIAEYFDAVAVGLEGARRDRK